MYFCDAYTTQWVVPLVCQRPDRHGPNDQHEVANPSTPGEKFVWKGQP